MGQLSTCVACDGFLPADASICPHCDALVAAGTSATARGLKLSTERAIWTGAGPTARLFRRAALVAVSGAFSLTLMACYGSGSFCGDDLDLDGDGFDEFCAGDCDDADPNVNPGALDLTVDGIDQNCDGVDGAIILDDAGPGAEDAGSGCTPEDEDRDGYDTCGSNGLEADCDDTDSRINPGATDDTFDGVDQNCNNVDGEDGLPADGGMSLVDGGVLPGDDGGVSADGGVAPTDDGGVMVSDGGGSVSADAGM